MRPTGIAAHYADVVPDPATALPSVPSGLVRQLFAAGSPGLAGGVGALRRALESVPPTANGRRVAVVGCSPGCGTSTVTAVLALVASAYTANRVVVLDTDRAWVPPVDRPGSRPAAGPVEFLLGGTGEGRLPVLLAGPDGTPVARSRVRAAGTPGAAVPVLAMPGSGSFAPQVLAQTFDRLTNRADLVLVDTPTDSRQPVFRRHWSWSVTYCW